MTKPNRADEIEAAKDEFIAAMREVDLRAAWHDEVSERISSGLAALDAKLAAAEALPRAPEPGEAQVEAAARTAEARALRSFLAQYDECRKDGHTPGMAMVLTRPWAESRIRHCDAIRAAEAGK